MLHTHWGINSIVVPVFGHTLLNSEGRPINVKDLCERDHLLVDYHHKFIPTLGDFVQALDDCELTGFEKKIEAFHQQHISDETISEIMLSPLAVTGRLHSLLLTHNSWFLNSILPRLSNSRPVLGPIEIAPSVFFNAMGFESWMDNGLGYPPSAQKLKSLNLKEKYND